MAFLLVVASTSRPDEGRRQASGGQAVHLAFADAERGGELCGGQHGSNVLPFLMLSEKVRI